jgi:AcrR family transcriptional regulator
VSTPRQAARRTRTDEKITAGVHAIIRREGLTGVTIDSVVAETGVAKTTIYRRYADRGELLAGVARSLTPPAEHAHPHTEVGLTGLIDDIRRIFEEHVGVAAFGAIMASPGPDLQLWRDGLAEPLIDQLAAYFRAGVVAGAFAPDADYEQVIDLVLGGLFIADARHGQVPDTWVAGLVDLLWNRISATAR